MKEKMKLQEEELWIGESERKNIPNVINSKYDVLKQIITEGNVYQAILCAKDLIETCMKLPAVMGIIVVNSFIEEDNDFESRNEAELKEQSYVSLLGILEKMISSPLSMGSWDELIQKLIKGKEYFQIDDKLVIILEKTRVFVNQKVNKGTSEKYENAINWRNDAIGHGIILLNEDIYWKQLESLVTSLNKYIRAEKGFLSLSELYCGIRFEGDNLEYKLKISDKEYSATHFVKLLNSELFYFDAYYSNKHIVKISDYVENCESIENSKYYEMLAERLQCLVKAFEKNGRSRRGKSDKVKMTGAGLNLLEGLQNVYKTQKPTFIIDMLNKKMDELKFGIIMLQMERGTGKSTLTSLLDGKNLKTVLQEDLNAIVRVYHIGDMNLIAENTRNNPCADFYKGMPELFEEHPSEGNIGRYNEQDEVVHPKSIQELRLNIESGNNSGKSIVELLSLYRDIYTDIDSESEELSDNYNDNRLILIIDGIDELCGDNTLKLLERLPSQKDFIDNQYAQNIFLILTSRNEITEKELPETSIKAISKAKSLLGGAEAMIEIEMQNEEYIDLLIEYVHELDKSLKDEDIKEIIEKADYKFLYVRPYMTFGNAVLQENQTEAKYVAEKYIEELKRRYFGLSLNTLYMVMGSIALFDRISLSNIGNVILGDGITYDLIGCIYDLIPLLNVRRDGVNVYEYANEEYKEYILYEESHLDYLGSLIKSAVATFGNLSGKDSLIHIEGLMESMALKAIEFDRIDDGEEMEDGVVQKYKELSYCMMESVLDYLKRMMENSLEIKRAVSFIDFINYIKAYGRANEKIKNAASNLEEQIQNYCASSQHVSDWFESVFVSGDTYGKAREYVIQNFGANQEIANYIISLADRKCYQGWYNHLHIENIRLFLENCEDLNIRNIVLKKLEEVYSRDFECPLYYKKRYEDTKQKFL